MPDDPLIRNTKPARTALLAGFAGALSQCLAAMLPVATGANGGLWWASVSSSSGSPSYLGIELCRKRRKRCQGQFLAPGRRQDDAHKRRALIADKAGKRGQRT